MIVSQQIQGRQACRAGEHFGRHHAADLLHLDLIAVCLFSQLVDIGDQPSPKDSPGIVGTNGEHIPKPLGIGHPIFSHIKCIPFQLVRNCQQPSEQIASVCTRFVEV